MLFCCMPIFFQTHRFRKTLSGKPSECQTVWTQIRHFVVHYLDPNCFQRFLADNTSQQTTLVGKELINVYNVSIQFLNPTVA